jgi:hypothetical protein
MRRRGDASVTTFTKAVIAVLAEALGALAGLGASAAESALSPAAAPPAKCEIAMATWCIREGASEIVSRFSKGHAYRRIWIVRGFFKPTAPLVVLEPYGCREGLSDVSEALNFEQRFSWDNKTWNRIRVRLKRDDSCNLDVLVPTFTKDPTGEAFFGGLALIQGCRTASCEGPGIGNLRGKFEEEWRRSQR